MKKIHALFVFALLVFLLVGCKNNPFESPKNTSYVAGTDAAKILLADERLDVDTLKESENIFTAGERQLRNLANKTRESLKNQKRFSGDYDGITIDGDIYFWDGTMPNDSNSYSYFKNITDGVIMSAESGALLIDNVKKNVRVLDKWIGDENYRFLLTVDDNSEIIYQLYEDQVTICRRTKNTEGDNIYDICIFMIDGSLASRMRYIPNKLVEFVNGNQRFYADNSKGYWDTFSIFSDESDSYVDLIHNFVMKDDLCYSYFYEVEGNIVDNVLLTSSDCETDIMKIYGDCSSVELFMSGFDGLKGFQLECPPDRVAEVDAEGELDPYIYKIVDAYAISGFVFPSLVLYDNRIIEPDTYLFDKNVLYIGSMVNYYYHVEEGIYTGYISLSFFGDTFEQRIEDLKRVIDDFGLTCRRDLDETLEAYERAKQEIYYNIEYKTWNGYSINSIEEMKKGLDEEKQKITDLVSLYDLVKDQEIISYDNQAEIERNISFADITVDGSTSVTIDDLKVTIKDLKITTQDTRLFVDNEEYVINLAFAPTSDYKKDLVHISSSELNSTIFTASKSFTVIQDGTFTIPYLNEGEYVLVGYISTKDGIRVTSPEIIEIDNFTEVVYQEFDFELTLMNSNNKQVFVYNKVDEVYLNDLSVETIDQLTKVLEQESYKYGLPSNEKVQYFDGSSWLDLDETQELSNIIVRYKFLTNDGFGFIYVNLL